MRGFGLMYTHIRRHIHVLSWVRSCVRKSSMIVLEIMKMYVFK